MDLKDIGKCIRRKRLEKSWRQEDLAEKTDLSIAYIGMIERGEKIPRLETFVVIANVLGASADELLSGVMDHGYKVRMSEYVNRLERVSRENRKVIYNMLDVLLESVK